MEEFLSYFIRVFLNCSELYVFCIIFFFGHKRKERFFLRLALGSALALMYIAGVSYLYALSVNTFWFLPCKLFVYNSSFILITAIFMIAYDDCIPELVLCGISAVAAHCIMSNIASSVVEIRYNIVHSIGISIPFIWTFLYFSVTALFDAPLYFVIWAVFVRKAPRITSNTNNNMLLFLGVATMLVTTMLSGIIPLYASESAVLELISRLAVIVCNIFILVVKSVFIKQTALVRELLVAKHLRVQEQKRYEQLKSSTEAINVKCHDLKHIIGKVGAGLDKEQLEELGKVVAAFDNAFDTNNDVLDVIIGEKSMYCNRKGIRFTVLGDASGLKYIKPADMYSLFGNAVDNAVEAADKLSDAEKKIVNLHIGNSEEGTVEIDIMNYYEGKITFKDGIPITSKEDASLHGYGVLSMKLIAAKYGGEIYVSDDDGIFRVKIVFPLKSA